MRAPAEAQRIVVMIDGRDGRVDVIDALASQFQVVAEVLDTRDHSIEGSRAVVLVGDGASETVESWASRIVRQGRGRPAVVLLSTAPTDVTQIRLLPPVFDAIVSDVPSVVAAQLPLAVAAAIERRRRQLDMHVEIVDRQDAQRREEAFYAKSGEPGASSVTSTLLGAQPLSVAAPELFESLAGEYAGIVEEAVELSIYERGRTEVSVADVVTRLVRVGAGARDVAQLHARALSRQVAGLPGRRRTRYLEESRMVLVRVLGEVLSRYRLAAVSEPPRRRRGEGVT